MSLGDAPQSGQAALRALAHPIRLRMLSLLTGAPLTAAEVARELGITHANASYHLRNLLAGGFIVTAGEEKIRGGVAKRYRYDPAHELAQQRAAGTQPPEVHRAQYVAIANELIQRTSEADWTASKQLGDADLWVDPEVWRDVRRRIAEALIDLHEAAQPPRTPGTVRTSTTVAMFELLRPQPPGAPE